jgi:chemotaxis protein histidine kinase CheA
MAGATIMGDGRVVLILDVATLFDGKRLIALQGRLAPEPALEAGPNG